MTLTTVPIGWAGCGSEITWKNGRVYQYRVEGLPSNEEAFIANSGWDQDQWKFLRLKDNIGSGWTGNFASADDALDFLKNW